MLSRMEEQPVRRRHRRDSRETRDREPAAPPEDRKSVTALACMAALVIVGVFIPGGPDQAVHGILFTAAGILMLVFPPRVQVPWLLYAVAGLFLALASLSFLPRDWIGVPGWRLAVEGIGLDTGTMVTPHPAQAAQVLAGAAVTLAFGLYAIGHRAGETAVLRLALAFALGVAVYTGASMLVHHGFWKSPWDTTPTFGLFPNRNHTATLLSMGAVVSLGVLLQAVRLKRGGAAGFATIAAVTCLWGLVGFSISRSGILLPCAGVLVWLALVGKSALSRKALAGILVFALIVTVLYWSADTTVKSRIVDTIDRASAEEEEPDSPAGARGNLENLDFRVPVQRDAVDMILAEPWTGSGGGTFRYVYPQHRARSLTANNNLCYHPESDWLQAAGEWGVPAALTLLGGVAGALWLAFRQGKTAGSRPLRLACLVAAAIVPFHGVIDVPGHRTSLAWAALLLLALAFSPPPAGSRGAGGRNSPQAWFPRFAGAVILLAGLSLIRAQWFGGPELAQARAERLQQEAWALFQKDSETLRGNGGTADPEAGLLRAALAKAEEAVRLIPLDPDYQYLRGALALQLEDGDEITDRSFALQRALDPLWIGAPLRQARAWSPVDPDRTYALWENAMDRSRAVASLTGVNTSSFAPSGTYRKIVDSAKSSRMSLRALRLAADDPALLTVWTSRAPGGALDFGVPWLLNRGDLPEPLKNDLLAIWSRRGGKAAVKAWKALRSVPPPP